MTELLKNLPYFDDLTDQEKERVAAAAYIRHYEAGTQIYGPCVECVGMIHILRGETRAYLLSDEGRKVTLFRVTENDNCIISASCVLAHLRFEAHMEVSKPSDILIVPVSLFGELCERNVHVRCFAYELATRRFSSVVAVMEQTLFFPLDKRLAGFLLSACRENGCPEVRMTQEELAARVNSVRETVGRMLKRFAADGIIRIRRGGILVLDMDKLEKAAV